MLAQSMLLVPPHTPFCLGVMTRVYGGAVVVAETCAGRYLQGNAIVKLVNGSFQGLTDLKHLYVTHPVPTAPRAWRVAQREIRGDFSGAHPPWPPEDADDRQ